MVVSKKRLSDKAMFALMMIADVLACQGNVELKRGLKAKHQTCIYQDNAR